MLPRHPRPERRHQPRLCRQVPRAAVDENDDLVGLAMANVAAGLSSTFVVNGSPTKTEMVDEAKSHTQVAQLTTAVVVAIVLLFLTRPLQYLPQRRAVGRRVRDRREADRHPRHAGYPAAAQGRVHRRASDRCRRRVVGVEQGIILAIVLSIVLHVRRHYEPVDVVLTWDEHGTWCDAAPTPGVDASRVSSSTASARHLLRQRAAPLRRGARARRPATTHRGGSSLDATSIDDIDFTGGKTLDELAAELTRRGIVLAIADARDTSGASSTASASRRGSARPTTSTPCARRSRRFTPSPAAGG